MSSESSEHKQIKKVICDKLKEWTGASLNEYPSAGRELDVMAVTLDGISVYVEVIWTPTLNQFLDDMTMIQQSDADIKIVVANPKIILNEDYQRRFSKVVISERRKGFMLHGDLINGTNLIDGSTFLNKDFKNIVLDSINRKKGVAERPKEVEFVPPEIVLLPKKPEELISNLFYVKTLPQTIFCAPTYLRREEDVIRKLPEVRYIPFILRNKMIFSFNDLNDPNTIFKTVLLQDVIPPIKTADWFKYPVQRNDLIALLNDALDKYGESRGLKFDDDKKQFIAQLRDGKDNIFAWRSGSRYTTREIAKLYYDKMGNIVFCKHYVASVNFMFLGDDIFLKIEPSLTFTYNGYRPIRIRRLIKLLTAYLSEQHNDGYRNDTRFWAKYLSRLSVTISIPAGKQEIEIEANPIKTKIERWV
jgi:hypothetical protein